jgi:hypothetical protein
MTTQQGTVRIKKVWLYFEIILYFLSIHTQEEYNYGVKYL